MNAKFARALFILLLVIGALFLALTSIVHPTAVVKGASEASTFPSMQIRNWYFDVMPTPKAQSFNWRGAGCTSALSYVYVPNNGFGHPACYPIAQGEAVVVHDHDDNADVATDTTVVVVDPPTTTIIDPPVIIVIEPPAEEGCGHGNTGNTKCVGNAGEDPNGKGTMDNDNAGGNGNGEHGNQGEGGNKNK